MSDKKETKRLAFGGLTVSFKKQKDVTIGEIMGEDSFPIGEMQKKIWAFIKKHELTNKPPVPAHKKLSEYFDETEFEDLDVKSIEKFMKKMNAKDKAFKALKAIFKKQEKNPEVFEEEIDGFINELIEASKTKIVKEAKAKAGSKKSK